MTAMMLRKIDDETKTVLRVRAAQNGRSMEAEVREILRIALFGERPDPPKLSFVESIRSKVEPLGGVELDLPPRRRSSRKVDLG